MQYRITLLLRQVRGRIIIGQQRTERKIVLNKIKQIYSVGNEKIPAFLVGWLFGGSNEERHTQFEVWPLASDAYSDKFGPEIMPNCVCTARLSVQWSVSRRRKALKIIVMCGEA